MDTPFQQHSDGSNAFASSKYIITLLIAMFGSRQTFQHCTHLVFCDSIKKLCALKQRKIFYHFCPFRCINNRLVLIIIVFSVHKVNTIKGLRTIFRLLWNGGKNDTKNHPNR